MSQILRFLRAHGQTSTLESYVKEGMECQFFLYYAGQPILLQKKSKVNVSRSGFYNIHLILYSMCLQYLPGLYSQSGCTKIYLINDFAEELLVKELTELKDLK